MRGNRSGSGSADWEEKEAEAEAAGLLGFASGEQDQAASNMGRAGRTLLGGPICIFFLFSF